MTICAVAGGILGEKIGRKKMMLLVAPLLAVGYIAQALANQAYLLNVGRFISGVAGGLACGPGGVNIQQLIKKGLRRILTSQPI